VFQGSSTADFSAGVTTLFTVTTTPAAGVYTIDPVNVTGAFQYVRYLAPANAYGNISELEFDGALPGPPPPPPAVPDAPTGLAATAISATDIHLAWQEDPSSTVSSFTIERQGPADAGYAAIGTTSGATTVFDDANTLAATIYSYEVIAKNISGVSTPALAATATTPAAPISPWSDSDIGAVGFAGTASVNPNGSITVSGSGADIWNQTDAFNFESQSFAGKGSIIAQVTCSY